MTMTHKYQNVGFNAGFSSFMDVDSNQPSTATFTASNPRVTVTGGSIPMVRGKVVLRTQANAVVCGNDCPFPIQESVALEFNVEHGAERLTALRAELNRLFDIALADYGFTKGLVPPVYAAFVTE